MNAKIELLDLLKSFDKIISAASICFYENFEPESTITYDSYIDDYAEFLNKLDRNYNPGFGSQELKGFILFTDGSWLERGEYDGSEWWELRYPVTKEFVLNMNYE